MTVLTRPPLQAACVKGVAIDLDGTLLRSDHLISPAARRSVSEISRRNLPVVLTSGRPPTSVLGIAAELEIDGVMVCSNGALVVGTDGTIIQSDTLPPAVLPGLIALIEAFDDLTAHYFSEHRWLTLRNNESVRREAEILGFAPQIMSSREAIGNINKIMVVGAPDPLQALMTEVHRNVSGLTVNLSKATHLEITRSGITKAVGLQFAAARHGLTCRDFVVFGDGDNDVPLFQQCGYGVAMGNASRDLKLIADMIIGTNDEDALAAYLDAVILQKRFAEWVASA